MAVTSRLKFTIMHTHDHHPHTHDEIPATARFDRAFAIGIALNTGFVLVEWVYGVLANSLALIADASHNLGDVLGLLLAWGAAALARRRPSAHFTYGLRGSTILAALANAALLLVITGGIAWEAILRFRNPASIDASVVAWVAALGIAINTGTALLFMAGRKQDLNLRGAYLHMAADAAVSLGVVVAALVTLATGWAWFDPAISLVIVAVIVVGTWGLLRDSVRLALHAVPEGVDPVEVRRLLEAQPGVQEVHDLHIWGMSTTETALTAHLVMPGGHPGDDFIAGLSHRIEHEFSIAHATLQVEIGSASQRCALAPDHVV
jgi:cobalt-zinc-cadmium efflux system protein